MAKTPDYISKYSMYWPALMQPVEIERDCIRRGGEWKKKDGSTAGNGLFYHHKRLQQLLHPEKVWHKWNELLLHQFVDKRIIGVLGPASSGKSREAADFARMSYYCWPECTTVIVSSTERETLEDRVWGEIKAQHKLARERYEFVPGTLIESRQRIVTDRRTPGDDEGRDFRNGMVGVPCFLTGTLIDTPDGLMPIETLKVGQLVYNAIGVGRVTEIHQRIAPKAVRVILSDGRKIDCTEEHPFFTDRGWINARDLETSDRVFSAHETMRLLRKNTKKKRWKRLQQILLREVSTKQNMFKLRKTNRKRLPKSKILFPKMPGFFTSKTMRTMRKGFPALESPSQVVRQNSWQILQHYMCGTLGSNSQRLCQKNHHPLPDLRQSDDASSLWSKILLSEMSKSSRDEALPAMWKRFPFYQAFDQTAHSFLQSPVQKQGHWASKCQTACSADARRTCSLETFSEFNFPLPPQNRTEKVQWNASLVSTGYCIPRNKTLSRNRWRRTSSPGKVEERQRKGCNFRRTWVDRIEILESSSDKRFDASKGGYRVHNLEVDGHPSYSVNGIIVHNCKKGGSFVGLGAYAGRKNTYVLLIADEGQFMVRAYVDALSNLNKNTNFKGIILGNPKDTTDALGVICEPSAELGGWDGGIDQNPGTKVWNIRWPNGVCVQLPGSDSPNLDGKLGIPLITQEQIDADIAFYGKDSLQFSMMDEGRMPRGQGLRRVITRQMCLKFGAREEPIWKSEQRTKIAFMDAAYGSVGGDRTIFGELQFGSGIGKDGETITLLALIDTMLVPVTAKEKDPNFDIPEHQIAKFVMDQCNARGIPPDHFFFDTTGRGSLMKAFAELWSPQIQGIEFGGKPSERQVTNEITVSCRDYYSKRVSELWFNVSFTIQSGQFRGMTEEVMQEGCMREWGLVGGNKTEVEPKDKMKLKCGRSCDLFDALVCGVEGARHFGFVIKRAAGVAVKFGDGWKNLLRERHGKLRARQQLNYRA